MSRRHPIVAAEPGVTAPAVAIRIADFLVRTEVERLRLFRAHLQATVRKVSPLLVDLAMLEGIALADAMRLVLPPQDWPWRPLSDYPPAALRKLEARGAGLGARRRNEGRRFGYAFAHPGVIVRPVGHPRGRFGIRPTGAVLGFSAEIGPCLISAFGSTALIKLPGHLPETLLMSLPGRDLGDVIDHPAFAGRDYTVRRVLPDLVGGLPVLSFNARLVTMALPWEDAL